MTRAGDSPAAAAVRGLFGDQLYRTLFRAVRERLERAGASPVRLVALPDLDDSERRALADLHGWPEIPRGPVRLNVADLDLALRRSRLGLGLRDVLEALGGPLVDRPAARAAAASAREALWRDAAEHPAVAGRPALGAWLEELRRSGRLSRASRAGHVAERPLLMQALEVAARLPAAGLPIAVLAAEITGDAHGLDAGRPLGSIVLGAATRLAGWTEAPDGSAARRRVWGDVGVLCDELSAHVLTLGLRPAGDERLARHLRESSDAGEPRRVTLRELVRVRLEVSADAVFICENPAVVAAAADALGARCAPLVCVEGFPSTAAMMLLENLQHAGAALRFHADFDWDGLRIGTYLHRTLGAEPWRFGVTDYRRAAAARHAGVRLRGRAASSAWNEALAPALAEAGWAVFEEQVVDELLVDLGKDMPA